MAKGGSGRMMSSSSGGIMGSGIFGMFGTVVLFLLAILYFVYSFATGKMGGKMRGGSGSWFPSKFFS